MSSLSVFGIALACCLAGLAGFVDALGFLHLGGLFVSFMSGNTTRLGIGLAGGGWAEAGRLGLVIGLFVAGATGGSLIGGGGGSGGGAIRRASVLLAVSGLLAAAAALSGSSATLAGCLVAAAMGAENAVFRRPGGAGLALTYVTGSLVKVGEGFAAAIRGEDLAGWAPSALLWASLLGGAAAGTLAYGAAGFAALWAAAIVAACLATPVAAATTHGHAG